MRVFALFFLFFIFLITFTKPLLESRGYILSIKDLSLGESNIILGEGIIYIPDLLGGIYIKINNITVGIDERVYIKGESINAIVNLGNKDSERSTRIGNRKGEKGGFDATPLVKLASKIDLHLKSVYVSVLNNKTANTLWIRDVYIESGKIWTNNFAWYVYQHKDYVHDLYVLLKKAQINKGGVDIERAVVVSSIYRFEGSGRWERGSGLFSAKGYILSIKNKYVYIPDIYVTGSGFINLSDIHIEAEGKVDFFHLRRKKIYRGARAKVHVHVKFGAYTKIDGDINVEDTEGRVEYLIAKDKRILQLELKDIYIDNRIIGIDFPFRTRGNLELTLDERSKILNLTFLSDRVGFLKRLFTSGSLRLNLNYSEKLEGVIKAEVGDITHLSFNGTFNESKIGGDVKINNLFINTSIIKGNVSFTGYVQATKGSFSVKGSGVFTNPYIYGFSSDRARFTVLLTNKEKTVYIRDKGVYGSIRMVDDLISGKIELKGKRILFDRFTIVPGTLIVNFSSDELLIEGRGINVSDETIEAFLSYRMKLKDFENPKGNFTVEIERAKVKGIETGKWKVKGNIENGSITANIEGDFIKGNVVYSIDKEEFRSRFFIKRQMEALSLNLNAFAEGIVSDFTVIAKGNLKYRHINLPINGKFFYKGDGFEGLVKGTGYKDDYLTIRIGDIRVKGTKEYITVYNGGAEINVLGDRFAKIGEGSINVDLRTGSIKAERIDMEGIVNGEIVINSGGKITLMSKGYIDLGRISDNINSLIRSRLLGKLHYYFSYNEEGILFHLLNEEPIVLLSRYVAVPLKIALNFYYSDNFQEGFILFSENGSWAMISGVKKGETISAKFEISKLPVRYITQDVEYLGLLEGEGEIMHSNGNTKVLWDGYVSGTARIEKLQKKSDNITATITTKPAWMKNVYLDIHLRTSDALRIKMPEGYAYIDIEALIDNNLYDPSYYVNINTASGELRYFGRKFLINKGFIRLERERGKENIYIDVSIFNPNPDYNIIIDMKGSLESPDIIVRSEPPRDEREILSKLILGGEAEGIIPAASTLISRFPQLSEILSSTAGVIGTDINVEVQPQTGVTGDVGLGIKISKEISKRVYIEYQSSNVQDPRATYFGGELKFFPFISIGVKSYSDRTREFNLRFRKSIDF